MNRVRLSVGVALAVGCASAATPPKVSPSDQPASATTTSTGYDIRVGGISPSSVTLPVPPERVWPALAEAYGVLGIRTDIRDSVRRVLGTRRFTQSRLGNKDVKDLIRCGNQGAGPSAASAHRVQLSIVSSLVASGGGTVLMTEVSGVAEPVEGTSTSSVRCVSKGDIEQRIHGLVAARVAEPGMQP